MAYIASSLRCTRLSDLERNEIKVIWLLLKPPQTPRPYGVILMVGFYYPPGQSSKSGRECVDYLTQGVDSVLVERPSAGVIIAGDLNSLNPCSLCHRLDLKRVVKAPTRGNTVTLLIKY